jgi:hypothetical protein
LLIWYLTVRSHVSLVSHKCYYRTELQIDILGVRARKLIRRVKIWLRVCITVDIISEKWKLGVIGGLGFDRVVKLILGYGIQYCHTLTFHLHKTLKDFKETWRLANPEHILPHTSKSFTKIPVHLTTPD